MASLLRTLIVRRHSMIALKYIVTIRVKIATTVHIFHALRLPDTFHEFYPFPTRVG